MPSPLLLGLGAKVLRLPRRYPDDSDTWQFQQITSLEIQGQEVQMALTTSSDYLALSSAARRLPFETTTHLKVLILYLAGDDLDLAKLLLASCLVLYERLKFRLLTAGQYLMETNGNVHTHRDLLRLLEDFDTYQLLSSPEAWSA